MATLSTDNFNRANQSGLGTASDGETWGAGVGPVNLGISSNQGTLSVNSPADGWSLLGSQTTKPINLLLKFKISNGNFGLLWRYQNANNWYKAVMQEDGTLFLEKMVSGSLTTITSTVIGTWDISQFWWIRVVHDSANLCKITAWRDGTSEPAAQISQTESSINAAGQYGVIGTNYSSTANHLFDDLTVTDNAGSTLSGAATGQYAYTGNELSNGEIKSQATTADSVSAVTIVPVSATGQYSYVGSELSSAEIRGQETTADSVLPTTIVPLSLIGQETTADGVLGSAAIRGQGIYSGALTGQVAGSGQIAGSATGQYTYAGALLSGAIVLALQIYMGSVTALRPALHSPKATVALLQPSASAALAQPEARATQSAPTATVEQE